MAIIKNVVQPFVTDLVHAVMPLTPSPLGGGFYNQVAGSSLIDSYVVSSGSANVYGTYLQGYGRGYMNYTYGSVSPSDNTFADGSTHNVWNAAQVNNLLQLTFGATTDSRYVTQNSIENTDVGAFKTVKLYNVSTGNLLTSFERADMTFSWRLVYGFVNGSMRNLFFPQWQQPAYEEGDVQYQYFVPQSGLGAQTVRIEFWS